MSQSLCSQISRGPVEEEAEGIARRNHTMTTSTTTVALLIRQALLGAGDLRRRPHPGRPHQYGPGPESLCCGAGQNGESSATEVPARASVTTRATLRWGRFSYSCTTSAAGPGPLG